MRMVIGGVMLAATLGLSSQQPAREVAPPRGTYLADLTWVEAEQALRPETVVVIPVGAASKEHGPHLKLRNDAVLAEYLTKRVATEAPVVIAPSVPYHFYPAFLEYPGSVSLGLETARDFTERDRPQHRAAWPASLLRPEHGDLDEPSARGVGRRTQERRNPLCSTPISRAAWSRSRRGFRNRRAAATPTRSRRR